MRGFRLLDEVGTKVGRIEEVWDDWLLVRVGRFGDVHALIPADRAKTAGSYAWVPYRIDHILATAALAKGGEPCDRIERELRAHYGLRTAEFARG